MTSAFKVRKALPADAESFAMLHKGSFADHWPASAFEAMLNRTHIAALAGLVNESEAPSGFVLIQVIADEAEILTICVSSEMQQRGLGAVLLRAACKLATEAGALRMFLEVGEQNEPARRLYEKCGFERVGQRNAYYREALQGGAADNALVMRKSLVATQLGQTSGMDYNR